MASEWIQFVKMFARKNGLTYKEALIIAAPYYRQYKGRTARRPSRGGYGSRNRSVQYY